MKIKTFLSGQFILVERRVLNTPARPCEEAESYSFTRCVLEFVAGRVGCHLDWVGTQRLPQFAPCRSLKEIEEYSHLLEEINDHSWVRLTQETGCYGKCHYKEYKFNKVRILEFRPPKLDCSAARTIHHMGCEFLLGFLPDGGEDLSGGAAGAAGVRVWGSHQWSGGSSRAVPGLVYPAPRNGP